MADVTLLDGRIVSSDSEDWRVECLEREKEARAILAMPKNDRRGAIDDYTRRNGDEAGQRLEANIRLVWQYRRQA